MPERYRREVQSTLTNNAKDEKIQEKLMMPFCEGASVRKARDGK